MKTPVFNFKKHQNFTKNKKMIIRFVIYSFLITVLMYLIQRNDNSELKEIDVKLEQIDVGID